MDLTIVLAVGALAVSVLAALGRSFDKSLSIREHEVFKSGVDEQLKILRERSDQRVTTSEFNSHRKELRNNLKRIHKEIDAVTATRPTTGELQGVSEALAARVDAIARLLAAQNGKG